MRLVGHPTAKPSDGFVKEPTDQDYVKAARWALSNKNHRLAIEQASAAAALVPDHEPYLKLLDEAIAAARGPLEILKLPEQGAFFGLCAARARALARFDRIEEALICLFAAASFSPYTPFLPWGVPWVDPARASKSVTPNALASVILEFAERVTALSLDAGVILNVEAALTIAAKVQRHQPPSMNLLIARSRAFRAIDRADDAAALLETEADASTWAVAVERAAIEGDRDNLVARKHWLERALAARPDDIATLLDLGEIELSAGHLESAQVLYDRAVGIDAASVSARLMAAYVRTLASGVAFIEVEATSESDRQLSRRLEADVSSYGERLADPTDPLVAVVRGSQSRARAADPPGRIVVRVKTERPPSPSAEMAFRRALGAAGRDGELIVDAMTGERRFGPLWMPGSAATAAVPSPSPEVLGTIASLATVPFRWNEWCEHAVALAAALKPGDEALLIDAMAHPPPLPSPDADAVRWVHGFQLAAAVLVGNGPDAAGAREERLAGLLIGIDDWSAAAALIGLRALCRCCPERRESVASHARALLASISDPLPPLARALAVLGAEVASDEGRSDFIALRAQLRADHGRLV